MLYENKKEDPKALFIKQCHKFFLVLCCFFFPVCGMFSLQKDNKTDITQKKTKQQRKTFN